VSERPRRGRSRLDTLVPLLFAYCALAALYVWQAWRRETPTIFTDELELTQISRAIADTGEPARRGVTYGFTSLVPWLTSPAWWLGSVVDAFEAVKYLQVLVMTTAIFPAYGLARLVVSRPWALFAAVGSVAAPALAYAPILVEEPFAYPAATLALYLILRAVVAPSPRSVLLAVAGCALASLVRSQLAVVFLVLALSLGVLAWRSPQARTWRTSWTRWDWVGAVLLALGAVFLFSALMSTASDEWARTTNFYKGRIFDYGLWATGAFTIGIGILPVIAALAGIVRRRSEWDDPRLRGYAIVTAAAFGTFVWYAAVKGAYLSTTFSSLVVERNLIYLAPVAFAGTALLLEQLVVRWWAAIAAGALVLVAVAATPTKLDLFPYYEAPGLSMLALWNREWHWPSGRVDAALVVLVVLATAVVVGLRLVRGRRRATLAAVTGIAVFVLAWNITNEVYAAYGEYDLSERMSRNFTQPHDWVDRAAGDGSVTLVGQQFGTDYNGIHLLEFWNRTIDKVWSVDPASPAPGPGPTQTPDLIKADGTLWPSPETDYALAVNGVALQSPVVARQEKANQTLYRLAGGPLRLRYNQSGVFSDGWMGERAAYNRFDLRPDELGLARVELRQTFCATNAPVIHATVKLGPLKIGSDRQPALQRVTDTRRVAIEPCGRRLLIMRPPPGPWRVEVEAGPTFVPNKLDPTRTSDIRSLTSVAGFDVIRLGAQQ
jgi:hypothetical protein